jgi:uncharacterized protein YgiM (DUF1202 family)
MRIKLIIVALASVLAGCVVVGPPAGTVAPRKESHLRAGPSLEMPVVGRAVPGQVLTVFGRQGNWIQVGDVIPRGWINAKLVY